MITSTRLGAVGLGTPVRVDVFTEERRCCLADRTGQAH